MNYKWLKRVAKISDDYTSIIFHDSFNQIIEPNTLPENLLTLIFGFDFNQKIKPNTLPENLTTLIFGYNFNQIIEPNILPENLTTLTFGKCFNRKIKLDSLPENLTTITFGCIFNQNIENILSDIKYINFNQLTRNIVYSKKDIEVINNIPRNFNVKIYVNHNIFDKCGPKWPIHVVKYNETNWTSDIYEIINKYIDPIYGDITVLINKKSYEPYSHAKSALK